MKDNLDRLRRENRELRRKLSVDEAAQHEAAQRLDAAHRRIYELTEEAAAAHHAAEAVGREFEDFRAAYARAVDGILHRDADVRAALDKANQLVAPMTRPFSAFLAEARLEADRAASFAGVGNGSGRAPTGNLSEPPSWSA